MATRELCLLLIGHLKTLHLTQPKAEAQPKAATEPPPKKARTGGLANMMELLRAAGDYVMQLYEVDFY